MPHDWYTGLHDLMNVGREIHASLHLDAVSAAFFDDPSGAGQGLLRADLVAHEGHIAHHKSIWRASSDSLDVVNDLVQGDRIGQFLALDHHP